MKEEVEKPWDNGKIIVSDNKRFLQFENGRPFFWLGDTAWLLFMRLNRMEVEKYLENRAENGYNVIQAMVIHGIPETNVYGNNAFKNKDFTKPVTEGGIYSYWNNIDYVINKARNKGLYMALVPVWGSVVKSGFLNEKEALVYGEWLANRYKDYPNIFWLIGGDIKGDTRPEVWKTLGKTIKKNAPHHLMTFHPFGRRQSSMWFHNQDWLYFNMFQSGHRRYDQIKEEPEEIWKGEDNWRYVEEDLAKEPPKPTLDGEPSYEGIPQGLHDPDEPFWQAEDCRRYAYWSVMAGACGHTYGHGSIMQMHKPTMGEGGYGVKDFWYDAIYAPGGQQMKYLKKLILSRPYFERIFDQSLIAGDEGERYERVIACRGQDYLLAYSYTGRTFSLNMEKISGDRVKTWWYNPRNGTNIYIGEYTNTGIQKFNPPGQQRDGNDWILVVDDGDKDFNPPGKIIEVSKYV
ncbi:MAG: glycoside hydrolase family 140 protein [bacterium]